MRRLIAWVLLILPLAACGNKGPLVRPGTPATPHSVVSPATSHGPPGQVTPAHSSSTPARQP